MKNFILVLLFTFSWYLVSAQEFSVFLKSKANESFGNLDENDVASLQDGFVVVNSIKGNKIRVIKLNLLGEEVWSRYLTISSAEWYYYVSNVTGTQDGGMIITGIMWLNKIFVIKLSSSGEVVWSRSFPCSGGKQSVVELSDSRVLILFRDMSWNPMYVALTKDGKIEESYVLDKPSVNSPYQRGTINSVIQNGNSLYLAFDDGSVYNYDYITRKYLWGRKYLSNFGFQMTKCSNGDLVFASCQVAFSGILTVYRTTEDGGLKWAKNFMFKTPPDREYRITYTFEGIHVCKEDESGNLQMIGASEGGLQGSLLFKIDAEGNYISNTKLTTTRDLIKPVGSNMFFLAGSPPHFGGHVIQYRNFATHMSCDTEFMHEVSNGKDSLVATLSVDLPQAVNITSDTILVELVNQNYEIKPYCNPLVVTNIEPEKESDVVVFPNPVHSNITVNTAGEVSEIKLYSATGEFIRASYENTINVEDLKKGIYFLSIYNNGTVITEKIVKE
jgi:hypothetical protein